mmetsp:Transcript_28385/g.72703  ORF Transcript_28385/g.72703 Transcript_28385/m.72703 type:complete len:231 (+) Transcript_28385:623-1315(+)
MASCLGPAEKIILPTWPEHPLRSSASGSGSAFIAHMAVSSRDWSPSGDSMVVQKKSRPPMSEAPSISTPFLPPSLMTVLRSFSAAFLSAASSFFGSSFLAGAASFSLAGLASFSFLGCAAFSAFSFSISSGVGLPFFSFSFLPSLGASAAAAAALGAAAAPPSPILSAVGPRTSRNSGCSTHVLNQRTTHGYGFRKAASKTSLNALRREHETTTSAAVMALPARNVFAFR